jgi:hypothetical protein
VVDPQRRGQLYQSQHQKRGRELRLEPDRVGASPAEQGHRLVERSTDADDGGRR